MKRFFFILSLFLQTVEGRSAIVTGRDISILMPGDSVEMIMDKIGLGEISSALSQTYSAIYRDGEFVIECSGMRTPRYMYFTFYRNGAEIFRGLRYILENNSNILIRYSSGRFIYSGIGAENWRISDKIETIKQYYFSKTIWDIKHVKNYMILADSSVDSTLQYLYENQSRVTPAVKSMIGLDIIGSYYGRCGILYYNWKAGENIKPYVDSIAGYISFVKHNLLKKAISGHQLYAASRWFCTGLMTMYLYDSCVAVDRPYSLSKAIEYFRKNYSGLLLEKLITLSIYNNRNNADARSDFKGGLEQALVIVSNQTYRELLFRLRMTWKDGVAYNFTLPDPTGATRHLSDYRGKVVLMEFWFTGCGNCRAIHPYVDSIKHLFNETDFILLSINIDKSINQWKQSIETRYYTTSHDVNLNAGSREGMLLLKNYNIAGCPTLILINKAGKLKERPKDPRIDNGEDLYRLISKSTLE